MQINRNFFYTILTEPNNVRVYQVTRHLTEAYPHLVIFPTSDSDFDVEEFAAKGNCHLSVQGEPLPAPEYDWERSERRIKQTLTQAHGYLLWNGIRFELIRLTWIGADGCETVYRWLIASTQEIAEHFFATVCAWNAELRGEVLVFHSGRWQKSEPLYKAIRGATFDNLILPAELQQELQNDLGQFFASHEVYQRYRIPWKRGLLLLGPPGNGKTHTIKALVNWSAKPCLYVKSLKARHRSDHDCIKAVFDRARDNAPCLLIMEDLDSLINDKNRSFFLNELDGFALNTGIVLIATTNHPDRLDPAILERPSRFDRKYHFQLPALPQRTAYIAHWNATLEPELRLSKSGMEWIARETESFSFAYLKELFVSAMMRWINMPQAGEMDAIMEGQLQILREQMKSGVASSHFEPSDGYDDDDDR